MERATERLQVREKEMTELMEEYSAASDQLDELRREVATFKEKYVLIHVNHVYHVF